MATPTRSAPASVALEGTVRIEGSLPAAEAVVFLEPVETQTGRRPEPAEFRIDQRGLRFHPHVLPIPVGSVVEFSNSDDVLHNIFSPGPESQPFDLGTWPRGRSRRHRFDSPGVWVLLCNVHPDMEAYIVVVPTVHYAKTDVDGSFVLQDVPPGRYLLRAWHENCLPHEQEIRVTESGSFSLELELEPRHAR